LSLTEWLVLCIAAEKPTHGFAISAQLGRVTVLGLIRELGPERSSAGPVRQLCEATPAGRQLARAWLGRPVRHGRDVRSELLAKLALLDRAGADAGGLVRAQRDQLVPVAGGLPDSTGAQRERLGRWSETASTAYGSSGARGQFVRSYLLLAGAGVVWVVVLQVQLTLVRPRLLRQRRSPGVGAVRPLARTWQGMRP
jgi:hypothetical protein